MKRQVEIIYNNDYPFDLSKVLINGEEVDPVDFEIKAKEGILILKFSLERVRVMEAK